MLAKRSPEKVTRHHVYNQNGYDTRPRDRRSTLVDKQITKSDDAIMWLLLVSHTKTDLIFAAFSSRFVDFAVVPLFQSESKCETIVMKMTLICMKIKLHGELIFI